MSSAYVATRIESIVPPMSAGETVERPRASRIDAWIRIGLIVAAFAPFVGTLFYGYIYDDTESFSTIRPFRVGARSSTSGDIHIGPNSGPDTLGLYRPLLMAFFAIIWNGAHKFAIAFHLFAIVLHAVATLLVAKLLRRGVGRWPAAAAALWFAVHPVHVEAVANITNVSEVMVCVWTVLLALVPAAAARHAGVAGAAA